MKILSLALENYQGIKNLKLDFNGRSCRIYGDNATGKTTVLNSISWVLTGRPLDEQNVKGYTPKPVNGDGAEVHNLNSVATIKLQLDDGTQVELSKNFHEIWKKKRGRSEAEYSGNTVEYFINGVPSKEKEYTAFLETIIGGVDTVRTLMIPEYFLSTKDWKERRAALMEVVGDITDDDVIASNPQLAILPDFLEIPGNPDSRYTVDDYRKIAASQKSKLNRRLDALPDLINEAKRAIPDIPEGITEETIIQRITEKQKELENLRSRLAWEQTASHPHESEAERQLAEIKKAKEDARIQHQRAESDRYSDVSSKLRQMDSDIHGLDNAIYALKRTIPDLKGERERLDQLRSSILADYQKIRALQWDESSEVCPTCGQRLTPEKIAHHRATFNQAKSQQLTELAERGKKEANKQMISELDARITSSEEALRAKQEERTMLAEQRDNLGQTIRHIPFEDTKICYGFDRKIQQLQCEVQAQSQNQFTIDNSMLTASIGQAGSELEALLNQKTALAVSKTQKARVDELEQEQIDVSEQFDRVEQGLFLCDEFVRTKVSLIDQRINGAFRHIRFKLFEEQQNGGLRECCEALIPSPSGAMVAFANANTAAKVNAALEVIDALGSTMGINLPVLIDGCESVTKLADVDMQVIATVVSETEQALTMNPNVNSGMKEVA